MKRLPLLLVLGGCLGLLSHCGGDSDTPPESSAPETASLPPKTSPWVYVTNEASGDMSIIDSATNEVIGTIPLGKRPRGIQFSPDKKTLYVALSGSPFGGPDVDRSTLPPADKTADGIGVFDIEQNKLIKILDGGSDPEQMAISADGTKLYVANEDVGLATIVDIAANKVIKTIPVGDEPEGVGISPDGKTVYITSEDDAEIFVIDTETDTLTKSFKVGLRPRVAAFLPDGSRAYITAERGESIAVVDTASHEVIETIPVTGSPARPMGIAVTPDGKKIFVTMGRGKTVAVIDTATNEVTGYFEVGLRPWGIAITPDGKTLYTANGPSHDVSVVDVETQTVVKKIPVGSGPGSGHSAIGQFRGDVARNGARHARMRAPCRAARASCWRPALPAAEDVTRRGSRKSCRSGAMTSLRILSGKCYNHFP